MTLFAGFFNRDPGRDLPDDVCRDLARHLDRKHPEQVKTLRGTGFFLANVDIGVFGGEGLLQDDEGRTVALTGEPLFGETLTGQRHLDLAALLHHARAGSLEDILRTANGVYTAVVYDPVVHEMWLITDKLGIRPIYIAETEDRVYFASALRVLEETDAVPKRMDLRGVTELASFGYSLGDRTGYSTIKLLRDGQYARASRTQGLTHTTYWRWDRVPTRNVSSAQLVQGVYDAFQAAVMQRTADERSAHAFLSGGLDSRAIVCVLVSLGLDVSTYNFSIPGTKDALYGRQFAEVVGTRHHPQNLSPGNPPVYEILSGILEQREGAPRAHAVWSGDGGSVGLGHVYMTQESVDTVRSGDPEGCARQLLTRGHVSVARRLLQPRAEEALTSILVRGMVEEMADVEPDDRGRAVYLFYLRNDQRRHLRHHFEDLDRNRIEFQLPFFDSRFLRAVLEVPLDALLRHAFYVEMLDAFPRDMKAVTWQVYPGHVSPFGDQADGSAEALDQWRDEWPAEWLGHARRATVVEGRRLLALRPFPDPVLKRSTLRLAYWARRLRIRDLSYLIRTASIYCRYWTHAGGEVTWP